MMTKRDPWVNMLRGTIAVFAAGVGGADAVTVLPCTNALGLPDRFARRIARNTQLILLEESNLARVADPAAGSGGVEEMTKQLCSGAWSLFQEIEKAGGLVERAAIGPRAEEGRRRGRRAREGDRHAQGTADRHQRVPQYPRSAGLGPAGDAGRVSSPAVRWSSRSSRSGSPNRSSGCARRPIACLRKPGRGRRSSSPISAASPSSTPAPRSPRTSSRRAASRRSAMTASPRRTARPSGPPSSPRSRHSGAKLACLCSSDKVYPVEAIETAKALAAAGATEVYLAGRPGDLEAALKEAGVQELHLRRMRYACDAERSAEDARPSFVTVGSDGPPQTWRAVYRNDLDSTVFVIWPAAPAERMR